MRYSILFIEFKGIGLDDGIFLFLSEVFEEFRNPEEPAKYEEIKWKTLETTK